MDPLRAPEARHLSFSDAERDAIRKQMERMLASPLFKNSKRYPTLLRYVIEHTLDGRTSELKERTLGVEVFGREPDYDTNADPVVRATAAEIRKRIAQYYHEHGHESEVRIELSPRSYVPEFEFPAPAEPAVIPAAAPAAPPPLPEPVLASRTKPVVAASVAFGLLALALWIRPWHIETPLDRFWKPLLESSSNVLLCVGQREFLGTEREAGQEKVGDIPTGTPGPISLFQLYYMGSQNVALPDVRTVARLTGLIESKGKGFHVRGQSSTNLADLRDGPVILVGAFNNDWTIRLMGPMRFSFEREGDTFWVKDRENPNKRDRAINYRTPYLNVTEDWAVISRVLDPTTDRMVVVAAGLTGYGTLAAGEFLTEPRYIEELAKNAPRNWERKNVQLLLATRVINGNSGPPRLVERYFW